MMHVAIVEDNEKDLKMLHTAVQRYGNEIGERIEIDDFNTKEKFLDKYKGTYDVVFMDINLNGKIDGINAAKELRKYDRNVALIFVTTLAQYAIKGYEVDANDYFVKPFQYYDLKMRLNRIRTSIKSKSKAVRIIKDGITYTLNTDDILYLESQGHNILYHISQGIIKVRDKPLKALELEYFDKGFKRCHASYLVNLKHCKTLKGNKLKVGSDTLDISRGMRREFLTALANYFHNDYIE